MPYISPEQQRKYRANWLASRRKARFNDKHCVKCLATEALELDHVDPTKKISHKIWSWSKVRRLEEIAKCQVLCSTCHKIKTYTQKEHKTTHGMCTMYEYWKCRCAMCKEWKRAKNSKRGKKKNASSFGKQG